LTVWKSSPGTILGGSYLAYRADLCQVEVVVVVVVVVDVVVAAKKT
jgi:hypothetical protein